MRLNKIFCLFLCAALLVSACGCDKDPINESTSGGNNNTSGTAPVTELDAYAGMSDIEKLVAVGKWESEGNPYNLMVFEAGGAGYIVKFSITYAHTWSFENGILTTDTEITQDIIQNTVYTFTMGTNYFIITNAEHNTSAKFYIEGTQAREVPQDGEKDSKLFGTWKPDDESYYGYMFNDDSTKSGNFSIADATQEIKTEFKWTVYDYELYIYYVNGPQYKYEYVVSGNKLTLYSAGKPNVVYTRID